MRGATAMQTKRGDADDSQSEGAGRRDGAYERAEREARGFPQEMGADRSSEGGKGRSGSHVMGWMQVDKAGRASRGGTGRHAAA